MGARLTIGSEGMQSQVVRTHVEPAAVSMAWRNAMIASGGIATASPCVALSPRDAYRKNQGLAPLLQAFVFGWANVGNVWRCDRRGVLPKPVVSDGGGRKARRP